MPDNQQSFEVATNDVTGPAIDEFAITPGATLLPKRIREIYVGVGGDLEVTNAKGATVIYRNVPQGFLLCGFYDYVLATNTTASSLIGRV